MLKLKSRGRFQNLAGNFGLGGIDFRIWVEIAVAGVSISGIWAEISVSALPTSEFCWKFMLKLRSRGCRFQHLGRNFGFRELDFRLWIGILVSGVRTLGIASDFGFQDVGFQALD